jgi:hypothetical protein
MKLSNLTVQQKFYLKLLEENESFSIKKRGFKIKMFDKNSELFNIEKRIFNNLLVLKKITEIKDDTYSVFRKH